MQDCLLLLYLCKETKSKLSCHCRGKKGQAVIQPSIVTDWFWCLSCLSPGPAWSGVARGTAGCPRWSSCHASFISVIQGKWTAKGSDKSTVIATHWWERSRQTSAPVSSVFWVFLFLFLCTSAGAAEPRVTWVYPVVPGGSAQRAAALEFQMHLQHLLQGSAFRKCWTNGLGSQSSPG